MKELELTPTEEEIIEMSSEEFMSLI